MIQRLIQEYIPNGVEYKTLGELIKSGDLSLITPSIKLKRQNYSNTGKTPIISQEAEYISGYCNINDKNIPEKEYVCFGDHSEHIKYVDFSFVQGADGLKIIAINNNDCKLKYIYYVLSNNYKKHNNYERHFKYFTDTLIPIPPIEVQNKIVSILDKFTELIDSLKIELSLRKKQYEYYREKLLNVENVEWKRLGDICNMQAGKAISASNISIKQTSEYKYPCYGGNGLRGYVARYNQEGSYPLIGRQGAFCGNVQFASGKFYATEHAIIVSQKISFNAKYLYYLLKVAKLNQYKTAGAQPGLSVAKLNAITVSILPLKEQERIVAILDKFDALCNDIYAEIELRKKQYEYYRDKLLQFEICNI